MTRAVLTRRCLLRLVTLTLTLANRVYDISDDDAGAEPYLGVPACLPGVLEAEAYDVGGLGLGYGDTQPE